MEHDRDRVGGLALNDTEAWWSRDPARVAGQRQLEHVAPEP